MVASRIPAAERRRLLRRHLRTALEQRGLRGVPAKARLLISGSQGTGKTRAALQAVAGIREPISVWITQPTTSKAVEVATDYAGMAGDASLPALVVRGRSSLDPDGDGEQRMCRRHEVAERVASAGLSVKKCICLKCHLKDECGYLRQDAAIEDMGGSGVFVMSRSYLFTHCPAPPADIVIADEALPMQAIDSVTRVGVGIAESLDLYRGGGNGELANAIEVRRVFRALEDALAGPAPFASLRAQGITADHIRFARSVVVALLVDPTSSINGQMSDEVILSVLDGLKKNDAPRALALLDAVLKEIDLGRDSINGVVFRPASGGDGAHMTIHRLRRLASLPHRASVLLLDGTGSLALNERLFGRLAHAHIPVERDALVIGVAGRGYARQSLAGTDRNGIERSPQLAKQAAKLRSEIVTIANRQPPPVLLISNKSVVELLEKETFAVPVYFAHFGAVRGLNTWENCQSAVVVGRESVSIANLEAQARAFAAMDPNPFNSAALPVPDNWPWRFWPVMATRGRRMADGTIAPVTVEVHPNLLCQELLEQIREAEVVQAADRVRPIFTQRKIVLLNGLALDVTYNQILSHAELVAGGTRWDRAAAATGLVPLGAKDLQLVHPKLFLTETAAREALRREAEKGCHGANSITIWGLTPLIYRRQGQRGSDSVVLVDLVRHPDPRAAVEQLLGPLVKFELLTAEALTPSPPATPPSVPRAAQASMLKRRGS